MRGAGGRRGRALMAAATLAGWALVAGVSGGSPSPAASASAPVAPVAIPVSLWPLDEHTRGAVRDTAGDRDGTIAGNVTVGQVAQGPTLTSYGFDGATGAIVVPPAARPKPVVAASAWLRLPRGDRSGTVVSAGPLRIALLGGHVVATACSGNLCGASASRATVDDGAWHDVIASAGRGSLSVYVDGVLDGTSYAPAPTMPGADTGVIIGAKLHGDLDQVALYDEPVSVRAASTQFRVGACPQAASTPAPSTSDRRALPALPLHTSGRFIVDAHGHRVKLAGVNWYGAEELDRVPAGLQCQSADAIAARMVRDGFNVVRLPWATDAWSGAAPAVAPVAVAANPRLRGLDARSVFDAVIAALARHGLMVILDNHVTRSDWCCDGADGNALWWEGYDPAAPPAWQTMTTAQRQAYFEAGQARWLTAWTAVASRYAPGGAHPQPAVVGVDVRNEPRTDWKLSITPTWGSQGSQGGQGGRGAAPWQDWPRAAELGGDTVLRANPNLLVAVEGINYASDLRGVASRPITLSVAHRLIYSAHDYAFTEPTITSAALRTQLGGAWGWLLTQHKWWTTPVWVGEFGACHPGSAGCVDGPWWRAFTAYLHAGDIDWTYWSFNGTGAHGSAEPTSCDATPRFEGCPEGYGVSDATWAADASAPLSQQLRALTQLWQR